MTYDLLGGATARGVTWRDTGTGERIFTTHFGGDPWVGTESPVVSTDDRITTALATR